MGWTLAWEDSATLQGEAGRKETALVSWLWVATSPGDFLLPLSLSFHLCLCLFLFEAPNLPFIHPQHSHEIKGWKKRRQNIMRGLPLSHLRTQSFLSKPWLYPPPWPHVFSFLPSIVHFPCPESFLSILRVRGLGASESYPNLPYNHAEFLPFPKSLHVLFYLPRIPFPLLYPNSYWQKMREKV